MGRHKFRLSDMIPNAWFYKLRDVRARRGAAGSGSVTQASVSRANGAGRVPSTPRRGPWLPHRESYYYASRAGELTASPLHPKASDMHFPPLPLSPPRKSKMRHRRRSVKPAPSAASTGCRCVRKAEPAVEEPDTPPSRRDMYIGYNDDGGEFQKPMSIRIPANDDLDGKVVTSATDITIDLRTKNSPEKVLRPILTRPARRVPDGCELEDKHIDLTHMAPRTSSVSEQSKGKPRRCVPSARRLKTGVNSPRVATKKTKPAAARTTPLAESFAVVKSSRDPRRDFRESMEEMIVENGIRTAGDLEDLLACYLSLNAAEYHDLIVEVFEQIWTSLKELKL